MATEIEKAEIARTFHTGLRTRDWDLLKSVMTDDIVWSLPGSSLVSGEARGPEAVIRRTKMIVSYGVTFTLKHVLFGQHDVALSLNNTAQRGDLILDEHLAVVLLLRDGKIFAINTYLSDLDMLNAFFV